MFEKFFNDCNNEKKDSVFVTVDRPIQWNPWHFFCITTVLDVPNIIIKNKKIKQ